MCSRFPWHCIQHQLFYWWFHPVLVSLIQVTSLYIPLYLCCYSKPPKVPSNQLHHLLLSSMSSYWYIMVQLDYLYPQLFILWHTNLSFRIKLFSFLYFLSFNTFTFAFFIFSTTLIILFSIALDFFILSNISTLSITTSFSYTALASNYSFFTNVLFLFSFLTPSCQSSHLLSPSVFPILVPDTCINLKSNLDKYRAHCTCLLFNF